MDPVKVYKDYNGRVFDIHLKDKRVEKTQGDDVAFDTQIGEGQANLAALIGELNKAGWKGTLAIETDSDQFARNPDDFVSKAKAFVEKTSGATR